MAGPKKGDMKAYNSLMAIDKDFYRKIGRLGGQAGHTGGFYGDPEAARKAGSKGGKASRRAWTAEAKQKHSEHMKQVFAEKAGDV